MTRSPLRRGLARGAGIALLGGLLLSGGSYAWVVGVRAAAPPVADIATSVEVLDREGRLLRPFALPDGRWRLAATPGDVDRRYLDMLVAYEDRRFYQHLGVDPLALIRAAGQMLVSGRIVSGGSTLTMQVARLMEPRAERSLAAKWRQMKRAIELEARLSKREILALYLALAPFGGNIEGVRAASLAYFGKEPRRLTLAEAALLVALPQAPEARRPDRNQAAAARARAQVLARLEETGLYGAAEIAFAQRAPIPAQRQAMPMLAAHAAEAARAERPSQASHRLAIDAPAQARLEELAAERLRTLGPKVSLALMMVDNASGEVLARVSGGDPLDAGRAGAVDLTRAIRSPGSTLKPFIYGLAFEDGVAHPDTLIEDRPVRFGAYRPRNFDRDYQGTVPVRQALQLSLNVPAVVLLEAVGPQRLAARLGSAGFGLHLPAGEVAGLAVGLGGVGMSLEALAGLYAGVANGGTPHHLRARLDEGVTGAGEAPRLMSEVAAWYLADALAGTPAPKNERAGRIAFKTGTSYGYRDAWAVGFDGRRTIAVWVGRPDGQPVPGMIGREAAAPILFEAFSRLVSQPAPLRAAPRGAIVARNAELPPPLRHFGRNAGQLASAEGPRIAFPPDGASLERGEGEALPLKVSGGSGGLTVLIDGVPAILAGGGPAGAATYFWQPAGSGFVRLTVMDAAGASDSVVLRIRGPEEASSLPAGRLSGR